MRTKVASRTIGEYVDSLAGTEPMPGGGSAAGIVGALAAATAQMMASLTKNPTAELLESSEKLAELRQRALQCALDDEEAYGGYLEALNLPKGTDDEKATRKARLAELLEASARVPLSLAVVAVEIVEAMGNVVLDGNRTVIGDASTAIVLATAVVDICEINVKSNLTYIKDDALVDDLRESIEAASEMIVHLSSERRAQIAERLAE